MNGGTLKKGGRTIYLIKRVEASVRALLEAALDGLPLTPGQYTVLSLLRGEREASSAELARRVGITAPSMSETLAALESKGFITRNIRGDNRRIANIVLTEGGCDALHAAEQRVSRLEKDLFSRLGAGQEATLRGILSALIL